MFVRAVYSAHEYTQGNARFAVSVEPGNAKLVARVEEINNQRKRGEATVPSLLAAEKETNPFLRGDEVLLFLYLDVLVSYQPVENTFLLYPCQWFIPNARFYRAAL